MIAKVRELDIACNSIHGGGRRPEPEFTIDPAEVAEYTAGVNRAVRANRNREQRERELDHLAYMRDFQ